MHQLNSLHGAVRSTTTTSRGNQCRGCGHSSTRRLIHQPIACQSSRPKIERLGPLPSRIPSPCVTTSPTAFVHSRPVIGHPFQHGVQQHGCTQGPTLFSHLHTFLTTPLPTIQSLTSDLLTVVQPSHEPALEINWASDMSTALNRTLQVMPRPSDPPPYPPTVASRSNRDRPIVAAEAIYFHATFSASGVYQDLAFCRYEQAARAGGAQARFRAHIHDAFECGVEVNVENCAYVCPFFASALLFPTYM